MRRVPVQGYAIRTQSDLAFLGACGGREGERNVNNNAVFAVPRVRGVLNNITAQAVEHKAGIIRYGGLTASIGGSQGADLGFCSRSSTVITSWTSKVKKQIVKAIQLYDEKNETKYIEAAIAAEMYRLILNGEYREKTLGNLTAEYLSP